MRFAVLGPLAVRDGNRQVTLSSPVQRVLLAMLLLNANKPVPTATLSEAVWDGEPPATARASLQNHVMRLRRALGKAVSTRLVTRAPGYLIEVRDGELDLSTFGRLSDTGRGAVRRGAWHEAAHTLRDALSLWTGEPIANVRARGPLAAEGRQLAELRLQTMELRYEAELRSGLHHEVIAKLRALTAAHPMRERFRELLMLALYRDGRQIEALGAYREIRAALVDEFGVEPGARIQRLHQRILSADPALDADPLAGEYLATVRQTATARPALTSPASPARAAAPGRVVPRQLPPAVWPFVGRQEELGQLQRWLEDDEHGRGAPVIISVSGGAGTGKTALAVHWAQRASARFPGGQLYLDLRGYALSGQPMELGEAIGCLLDALGVPAARIPATAQARIGLYRSLLADREPMLVLLDNARDAEQVRLLLPAAPGCLAIVTSRDDLTGLSAIEGALSLALDVLSQSEARELLASRVGAELSAAVPEAVDELCGLCARLPLALTIAAARAALPSGPSLPRLVTELRDSRGRLDALDTGDRASSVRVVLSWSYRRLSTRAARMFRLLGAWHGPDVNVYAAAGLAGVPVEDARRLLTELTRAGMLTRQPSGRLSFHDLLRAYAAERAETEEGEPARRAALSRLLDFYLRTARAAEFLLYPARDTLDLELPAEGVMAEPLAGPAQAAAWFESERQALLVAVRQGAEARLGAPVWQLAWMISAFLERRGYWADLARSQRTALAVAGDLGDARGLARSHRALGLALIPLNVTLSAREHLMAAYAAYADTGERAGQARVSLDLSMLAEHGGDDAGALAHAEHALCLFTAIGHLPGQGRALNCVGWFYAKSGDTARALSPCTRAVTLCAKAGDRVGEAAAWDSLACCYRDLGDYRAAVECGYQAVRLTRLIGDHYHHAKALETVGDIHESAGDAAAARAVWRQALVILGDLGHPDVAQVLGKVEGPLPPG